MKDAHLPVDTWVLVNAAKVKAFREGFLAGVGVSAVCIAFLVWQHVL